jgi:hypothetical protein
MRFAHMAVSKGDKRKARMKAESAKLPAGVKVVPAPKHAAFRKLLTGRDIETSGGCRTIYSHSVDR